MTAIAICGCIEKRLLSNCEKF